MINRKTMKSRWPIILLTSFLILTGCARETPSSPPNIIFILADDLGYGDLGCYGQERIRTPNIDRLAAEGMRFTRHYAGSTVCAPSRSCLMTGLHTGHTKVRGNVNLPLDSTDVTVAQLLKEAGYLTGLVGKWGLGEAGTTGIPNRQGFDYFFGYLNQVRAHNYYPDYLWRNQEKVPLDNEIVIADSTYAKGLGSAAVERVDYSHDLFTKEALSFIERSRERPFFLYLAYTIPHANNEYWLTREHGMEVPDYGPYADRDWPAAQKGLAAMISRLDRDVGSIVGKLQALGLDENTLLLFSSDNGPHAEGGNDPDFFDSNGPLRGIKRDLYEGGIRVPLIARWPGHIAGGETSDHLSAFWDFLPTACETAGISVPENIDGISFLPELLGNPQPGHEYLYWEFYEADGRKAIRQDDWKGVQLGVHENPEAPLELYDLSEDLSEKNEVSSTHPEVVERLKGLMEQAHTPSPYFKYRHQQAD
jgi:arylsulfatase A-like enzyme